LAGNYLVEEILAPDGYIGMAGQIRLHFDYNDSYYYDFETGQQIHLDYNETEINGNQVYYFTQSLKVPNRPILTDLKFTKYDDSLDLFEPLAGVKFTLDRLENQTDLSQNLPNALPMPSNNLQTITSDEDGLVEFLGLKAGYYLFEEAVTKIAYQPNHHVYLVKISTRSAESGSESWCVEGSLINPETGLVDGGVYWGERKALESKETDNLSRRIIELQDFTNAKRYVLNVEANRILNPEVSEQLDYNYQGRSYDPAIDGGGLGYTAQQMVYKYQAVEGSEQSADCSDSLIPARKLDCQISGVYYQNLDSATAKSEQHGFITSDLPQKVEDFQTADFHPNDLEQKLYASTSLRMNVTYRFSANQLPAQYQANLNKDSFFTVLLCDQANGYLEIVDPLWGPVCQKSAPSVPLASGSAHMSAPLETTPQTPSVYFSARSVVEPSSAENYQLISAKTSANAPIAVDEPNEFRKDVYPYFRWDSLDWSRNEQIVGGEAPTGSNSQTHLIGRGILLISLWEAGQPPTEPEAPPTGPPNGSIDEPKPPSKPGSDKPSTDQNSDSKDDSHSSHNSDQTVTDLPPTGATILLLLFLLFLTSILSAKLRRKK
jgi:hypothetical protein